MDFTNKAFASGGALGVAALMLGSLAIAAKSRPVAGPDRNNFPPATVNHPNNVQPVDPDGINIRLGMLQKRVAQSASRVVEAGLKRRI